MRLRVSEEDPREIEADVLVILVRAGERAGDKLPLAKHLRKDAASFVRSTPEATTWLETRNLATPRALVYTLGPEPQDFDADYEYLGGHAGSFDREAARLVARRVQRNAGAQIERACHAAGASRVVLVAWPEDCDPHRIIEGMYLRAHDPRSWEKQVGGAWARDEDEAESEGEGVRELGLLLGPKVRAGAPLRRARAELGELAVTLEATNFARELGDLPSNLGHASQIVERVASHISTLGIELRLSTIEAAAAAELGMGLFTAVDAGAPERGCILRLDHRPDLEGAPLVLLGKGLTHDTGGYNLKRNAGMHQLTHDKCGATAVIGAMIAISRLDLPLRVVALCPLTENAVDAKAYKPGDILRACNGTTVYIENTDAEGRLVLADTLAWLQGQDFEPELVIDLATLTGAAHSALGEPFAALYCNEDRVRELLVDAGERCGELLWPMPIHEIHDRDLGHHKADMRNVGVFAGGPSSAAAFLRAFVEYPWAHIDLAGKANAEFARECYGPGATGFGCRLLVEFAHRLAT